MPHSFKFSLEQSTLEGYSNFESHIPITSSSFLDLCKDLISKTIKDETLPLQAQRSIKNLFAKLSSINPLSFNKQNFYNEYKDILNDPPIYESFITNIFLARGCILKTAKVAKIDDNIADQIQFLKNTEDRIKWLSCLIQILMLGSRELRQNMQTQKLVACFHEDVNFIIANISDGLYTHHYTQEQTLSRLFDNAFQLAHFTTQSLGVFFSEQVSEANSKLALFSSTSILKYEWMFLSAQYYYTIGKQDLAEKALQNFDTALKAPIPIHSFKINILRARKAEFVKMIENEKLIKAAYAQMFSFITENSEENIAKTFSPEATIEQLFLIIKPLEKTPQSNINAKNIPYFKLAIKRLTSINFDTLQEPSKLTAAKALITIIKPLIEKNKADSITEAISEYLGKILQKIDDNPNLAEKTLISSAECLKLRAPQSHLETKNQASEPENKASCKTNNLGKKAKRKAKKLAIQDSLKQVKETVIKEDDSELEQTQADIQKLKEEIAKLKSDNAALVKKANKVKASKEKEQAKSLNALRDKIKKLETYYSSAQASLKETQTSIKDEHSKHIQQIDTIKQVIVSLTKQNQTLEQQITQQKSTNFNRQLENKRQLEAHKKETEILQEECDTLDDAIKKIKEAIDKEHACLQAIESAIPCVKEPLATPSAEQAFEQEALNIKLKEMESQNAKLNTEYEALQSHITQLEGEIAGMIATDEQRKVQRLQSAAYRVSDNPNNYLPIFNQSISYDARCPSSLPYVSTGISPLSLPSIPNEPITFRPVVNFNPLAANK